MDAPPQRTACRTSRLRRRPQSRRKDKVHVRSRATRSLNPLPGPTPTAQGQWQHQRTTISSLSQQPRPSLKPPSRSHRRQPNRSPQQQPLFQSHRWCRHSHPRLSSLAPRSLHKPLQHLPTCRLLLVAVGLVPSQRRSNHLPRRLRLDRPPSPLTPLAPQPAGLGRRRPRRLRSPTQLRAFPTQFSGPRPNSAKWRGYASPD